MKPRMTGLKISKGTYKFGNLSMITNDAGTALFFVGYVEHYPRMKESLQEVLDFWNAHHPKKE